MRSLIDRMGGAAAPLRRSISRLARSRLARSRLTGLRAACLCLALGSSLGCGAVVEPGHRALFFDSHNKGLRPDVLGPGHHSLGAYGRLEDFDVTYSTSKEVIHTSSAEGLAIDLHLAIIYRPIVSELYELDNEIGRAYYEEVVGPEFRSAARGVFAQHSYADLQKQNEKIEDEIEGNVRRRIAGKHVEVSSVVIESVEYAPEIWSAHRVKLVNELEAARQRAAIENDALKEKLILKLRLEQDQMRAENDAAREDMAIALQAKRAAAAEARAGAAVSVKGAAEGPTNRGRP